MNETKETQVTEKKNARTKHGKYRKEQGISTLPESLPLLIDVATTARLGGWSQPFVRTLCRSGELPAVHVGNTWRVRRDDLLEQLGLSM
ncbi:MAG: helix-turn-helix domain-containing protein [Atopobiaceae bacterium]|nr:helix-turn-helix domain-containing protein [Atopobiaceae bacterium]